VHLSAGGLVSVALFVGLYVVLVTEWVHRAVAALLAAVAAVALGLISPAGAAGALDLNTLILLLALMVLVAVLEHEGLFVFLAERAERWGGGSPRRVLIIFLVLVALVSAFLPNVTVILILGPALITLAEGFGLNPLPILILGVVASNLGGMATLVGDPPNILIGTAASLDFVDFLRYLAPLAVVLVVLTILRVTRQETARIEAGTDREPVFRRARSHHFWPLLAIAALTAASFVLQPSLGMPIGLLALLGALLAVLVVGSDFDTLMTKVDWSTLAFFAGLFVVVGALVHQGVVASLSSWILAWNLGPWLGVVVLLGTAVLSALLDNLPIVAAMIPLVDRLTAAHPAYFPGLWVALAIGAAVGGNATLYGAAANVVAGSLAKARGYRLSFRDWMRTAGPLTMGLLVVAVAWMWVGGFMR
jgi:Na+/H+ antiporter NhaD/arsenite permease-like protein